MDSGVTMVLFSGGEVSPGLESALGAYSRGNGGGSWMAGSTWAATVLLRMCILYFCTLCLLLSSEARHVYVCNAVPGSC